MKQNSAAFYQVPRVVPRITRLGRQFLITTIVCGVAGFATSAAAQSRGIAAPVRAVIDGDTIRVGSRRIGLLGITAPGTTTGADSPDSFAREARDRLSALVILRFVRLEYDGQRRGRAYVFTEDGVFVNAEMVRAGLACVTGPPALKRFEALRAAEAEARNAQRGMWSRRDAERPSRCTAARTRQYEW